MYQYHLSIQCTNSSTVFSVDYSLSTTQLDALHLNSNFLLNQSNQTLRLKIYIFIFKNLQNVSTEPGYGKVYAYYHLRDN